jgi:Xaa-Pro aminopeptidase
MGMEEEKSMVEKKVLTREVETKLGQVRGILSRKKLAGALITRKYNIYWLTAGGNNQVLYDMQESLIGILVTENRAIVIAENGDYGRVMDEEFSHCPFEYEMIYWCSGGVGAKAAEMAKGSLGVDSPVGGVAEQLNIDGDLAEFRQVFLEPEIERLRSYGAEAASIITKVSKGVQPGMSEREVAAELSKQFLLNSFNVAVILIGGDERSLKYRHQVVSDHKIRRHFSLCGVGKKAGITYPINRVISFGPPPPELEDNNRKIETVFVHLNSLAKAGTTLGSIYAKLPQIYVDAGLEEVEWMRHSIGGTMGYNPREQVVGDRVAYRLRENNVIGWNPSLPGVMAEDVYLLGKSGLEFITYDEHWPHAERSANGLTQIRPSILVI